MSDIGSYVLGIVTVFLVASHVDAAVLRVPEDHATLLSGLDAASPGDTVLVRPGRYTTTESPRVLRRLGYLTPATLARAC